MHRLVRGINLVNGWFDSEFLRLLDEPTHSHSAFKGAGTMTEKPCHVWPSATGSLTGSLSGPECREERCRLGVSQQRLAALAGVSERCLRTFERGASKPQRSTVEAVYGALQRCGGWKVKQLRGAA